jgi:hypothetical protein
MIAAAIVACLLLVTFALAPAFAWQGRWLEALLIVGAAVLALAGQWRGWRHAASLAFVVFVVAAALGMSLGLGKGQSLLAVAGSLCMWDLAHYSLRLRAMPGSNDSLDRRHLSRLLIVAAIGVAVGMLATGLRIKIGIGAALALGLLAVVGLSQAIRYVRRQGD